jgi:hypothetical protein
MTHQSPGASTSALAPRVSESIAPRSGAEASPALERCPNPRWRSPSRRPVARGKCRVCDGTGILVPRWAAGKNPPRCDICKGTGREMPARASERGANIASGQPHPTEHDKTL